MKNLKFSESDEWVRAEGKNAWIGITDHAQSALGDIVFVELPETGTVLNAGDSIGAVESVKTAVDVYTPVSGTVLEVNQELTDAPEKLNEAPYESWIIKLEMSNPEELESLMDEDAYQKLRPEGD